MSLTQTMDAIATVIPPRCRIVHRKKTNTTSYTTPGMPLRTTSGMTTRMKDVIEAFEQKNPDHEPITKIDVLNYLFYSEEEDAFYTVNIIGVRMKNKKAKIFNLSIKDGDEFPPLGDDIELNGRTPAKCMIDFIEEYNATMTWIGIA